MARMNQQAGRGHHTYRGERQILAATREELEKKIKEKQTYSGEGWGKRIPREQLPDGQWRIRW